MKAPCRQSDGTDCHNRAVGCQIACEKYREYRAEKDRILEAKRKDSVGAEYAREKIYRNRNTLKHSAAARKALGEM